LRERTLKIALYCPLNDPDDGGTSGDRRMARQIRTVLISLGHVVQTIVLPRSHVLEPDGEGMDRLKAAAKVALDQLQRGWALEGRGPDLWMTYHNYHKAPDLLGPLVTAAFAVPYVIVEASYTASKHQGPWRARTEAACAASAAADLHFCFTQQDRDGLLAVVATPDRLVDLPPFIDAAPFANLVHERQRSPDTAIRLISVAMMRQGGKAQSYAALAQALALMPGEWSLSLVGDGAARPEIEAMFQDFDKNRITFAGLVSHTDLPKHLATHDLFVWPGLHEPFGLVFLEAQAAGLPVVAFRSGGVPDTVQDGKTALLVPESDVQAFATTVAGLAADHGRHRRMAIAARHFAMNERGMAGAAKVVAQGLDQAIRLKAMREATGA
jgi:glycosyltransferase involved in cell wall biosynthesis